MEQHEKMINYIKQIFLRQQFGKNLCLLDGAVNMAAKRMQILKAQDRVWTLDQDYSLSPGALSYGNVTQ